MISIWEYILETLTNMRIYHFQVIFPTNYFIYLETNAPLVNKSLLTIREREREREEWKSWLSLLLYHIMFFPKEWTLDIISADNGILRQGPAKMLQP